MIEMRNLRGWQRQAVLLGGLFALSLFVRLLFWGWAWHCQLTPRFDEAPYLRMAHGYAECLAHLVRGEAMPSSALNQAYRNGLWPPLHPMLLGLFLFALGPHVIVARLAVVVVSALTTPVVFLLARRMAGRNAALAAAAMHMGYPSFVAFSHLLWTESLYGLLVLLAVWGTVSAVDAPRRFGPVGCAAGAGICLGLAGLVKASVLPFLGILPFWLACCTGGKTRKLAAASALVVAFVLVVGPWELLLYRYHGYLVPFSRNSELALVLATHDYQNAWPGERGRINSESMRQLDAFARKHQMSTGTAAKEIYRRYLAKQSAGDLLHAAALNMRGLWAADFYLLRHTFRAIYPPLPWPVLRGLIAVVVVAYGTLLVLALFGLASPEIAGAYRLLVVMLIAGGTLPYLLTIGLTRYHFPFLLLLLPFAGHGALALAGHVPNRLEPAGVRRTFTPGKRLAAVTGALALGLLAALATTDYRGYVKSYYYRHLFENDMCTFRDVVTFRAAGSAVGKRVGIRIAGEDYTIMHDAQPPKSTCWDTRAQLAIILKARDPRDPPTLTLQFRGADRTVTIRPVTQGQWKRWRPSGLEGIQYQWTGGR